jgi:EAL domain-containing protein (putative c-di-GMP-specific phosphodiesterase class I)
MRLFAFSKTLGVTGDSVAIVDSIINLAHSLNLKVVAEGVEAEEQAGILRRLNCDLLQGYLLGRPVPWEELTVRLRG